MQYTSHYFKQSHIHAALLIYVGNHNKVSFTFDDVNKLECGIYPVGKMSSCNFIHPVYREKKCIWHAYLL